MHAHTEIEIETATRPIGLSTEPEDRMHAIAATQLTTPSHSNSQTRSPAMTHVTTTTQTTPIRPVLRRRSRQLIAFDHAKRELKWAFAAKHSGKVLDASAAQALATIEGWLIQVAVHHRGAIGLRWSTKTWPKALHEALEGFTALALRLHCMENPGVGSTASLEMAAALEFDVAARAEGKRGVAYLRLIAGERYDRAVWKYLKVRGDGRCVVPVRKRIPRATAPVSEPMAVAAPATAPPATSSPEPIPDPVVAVRRRSDLQLEVAHAL